MITIKELFNFTLVLTTNKTNLSLLQAATKQNQKKALISRNNLANVLVI